MVNPMFSEIYSAIESGALTHVMSEKGTIYTLTAKKTKASGVPDTPTIIAVPGGGQVRIHADCWLHAETCQRSRAGGVNYGILQWWRTRGGSC